MRFSLARCSALVLLAALTPVASAQEPVKLREQFPVGYQYHVSSRVEINGSLTLPPQKDKPASKPLTVTGTSAIEYDERILAAADGQAQKTLRIYRKMNFDRKVGDQPQQSALRPAVRRLVLIRHKNAEVPFSPDGPLLWGEIDLIRVDVFTPALLGLLPDKPVRVGDRWTASNAAVEELTDMDKIDEGRLECRLEELTTLAGRRHARISLLGSVRGLNEDGPNRQQVDGYFYFDLESNHLSYLTFKGVHALLDKDGKESGRIEGRFVLTRQAHTRSPDLSDEVVKALVVEPNADNTQLLYENPDLGVRFLYPRRWRIGGVSGRQVTLEEPGGNGLLLTLDPLARVPTIGQFLIETRDFFQKQKAKVLRTEDPRRIQAAPQEVETFALEIEMGSQKATMDYYVFRQAQGGGTVAARLLPTDLAATRKDVERMVRSVTITAAQK
ncbi:MAG: hypothetical protein K2R98_07265 [Gemmataceae bacterium]|nr:hypothetical protein [Gemmataceae bacterium]